MGRITVGIAIVAALLLAGCSAQGQQSPTSAGETESARHGGAIVMIGDSIMRGYGLSSSDLAWPQLLARDRSVTIDNLACDGAGFLAVGASSECDSSFESIVSTAIDLHPATVFIEGSDNDFGEDGDALEAATVTQIERLRSALPDATIIGLSTISGATADPDQLALTDSRMERAITSVGGRFLAVGQPYSGNPKLMQQDQEHPTSAGQLAITRAVERALDSAGITLR
jgi:lysophospholipase L1-like esterase